MFRKLFLSTLLLVTQDFTYGQSPEDKLVKVVVDEMNREMAELAKAPQPPYYLAYRINDSHSVLLTSSFGSIVDENVNHARFLYTDVKVGSYEFDDSHPLEDLEGAKHRRNNGRGYSSTMPLDDKPEAIQLEMWQQTQQGYRQALNNFKEIKNATKLSSVPVGDFSKEEPSQFIDGPLPDLATFFNLDEWKVKVKKFSAPFLDNADIVKGEASLQVGAERKYFFSSEGTRIAQNRTYVHLSISSSIRTVDGDLVPLHLSYYATQPGKLPSEEKILADVMAMVSKLNRLKSAPMAEPYTGPAILSAHAAGVFFHEIFGHRVEGQRLKNKNDGQTFKSKIGEQVLPKNLSVIFDPTREAFKGQELNGYYQFDDEGVKARKVTVVDKGVLKTFLMSRTPIENFGNSNGHGRTQGGQDAVSRQSNLFIENEKIVPPAELRKLLLTECQKQKKEYGYLFADVVGGFTTTQRIMPNAFNIFPTEVYRVYVDGRPDELVRGVDLIGTPLAMFAEIQAADDETDVFTGFCGAESGSVPVTAVSPSLFVRQIETQKKPVQQIEKTILPRPVNK
jgi:TldD protein